MKIQRILKINNIGIFEKYLAHGDVTFTDFTVIYGENGKGKTTLCIIFQSLKSGSVPQLAEKKRVGVTQPIDIDILLESNIHACFNESIKTWTIKNPEIEIFDTCLVNNIIYSGDHIDHYHKKNLYYLIVGKTGVELAQAIEQIDTDTKKLTDLLKQKEGEIKGHIKSKSTVDSFIDLPSDSNIDQKIILIEKEIRAFEEAERIKKTGCLSEIIMPKLLIEELNNILNSSLDKIAHEAENNVKSQCALLGNSSENWIKQGVDFLSKNSPERCPFCGQNIEHLDLIHYYQDFFNHAYTNLKCQISTFYQRFEENFSSKHLLDIQSQFAENRILLERWGNYFAIDEIDFDFEKIQKAIEIILSRVRDLIERKDQMPLEKLQFPTELQDAINEYEKVIRELNDYNIQVSIVNKKINDKKTETQSGNLINVKVEKLLKIDTQTRYSSDVDKLINEYLEIKKTLSDLKYEKLNKNIELKAYSESVLQKYQISINEYLSKFGAEFEIIDSKTSLQGGKPSASYMLRINKCDIPLGTIETEGEPCFRTILSEGDKNSLAFAFFMAQLKLDPDLSKKTIIIDDPITSLDVIRKNRTFEEIREISKSANQTIVLSHDAYFLKLFWDKIQNIKSLQIKRDGNQSTICEWDIYNETLPSYLCDYNRLTNFCLKGETDLRGVARCIRPVLEGYLRFRFPKSFDIKEWLGDFIGKIEIIDSTNPLSRIKPYLTELTAINDYSSHYHHQQNPAADKAEIFESELKTFAKKTLDLIEQM